MSAPAPSPQELLVVVQPEDLLLEWQPAATAWPEASLALQQETFRRFHAGGATWLFQLGFAPEGVPLPESLAWWRGLASLFARRLALAEDLETRRERARVELPAQELAERLAGAPPGPGQEYLSTARLAGVWDELNVTFQDAVRGYQGTVEAFLHGLRPDLELAGRVYLHLVENSRGPQPFAFLATYSTRVAEGSARHLPLHHALQEYRQDRAKLLELLAALYRAAHHSALLRELLDTGRIFQPLAFDAPRALTFLKEVSLYEAAGIRCRIPNWWTARSSRVALSVNIGDRKPATLGLDALVACVPSLSVGGEPIGLAEARQLLSASAGLVLLKNKWVEVDPEKLRQTIAVCERAGELLADGLSLREAMRLMLDPGATLGEAATAEVTCGDWLAEVLRKLASPERVRGTVPGPGFAATLRPYQQQGLDWLAFLDSLGFGACLADDMGLGKTVQVLAWLSVLRTRASAPCLLVVPASLLGNWQREIARFLPELRTLIAHPSQTGATARQGEAPPELGGVELVITTYGMVLRCEWLRQRDWRLAILDEAQAIKNPGARQTRAVKQLRAQRRLILTGTPVENRLGDLWSLFDFLNPGLLGSAPEFKRLAARLQGQEGGYGRLRRVVGPYILRRLKTDKAVIADLPEKIEVLALAELGRRQAVLYRQFVAELEETLERAEGIQRRGLVLSALLRCKQLCNHPDQFLGSGPYDEADSGKFARLREICETILEKRERLLVFTQFRELVAPLDRFLAGVFGHPGLTLDGSVAVKQRQERVAAFQETRDYVPYMVLSVKAGGVGLNLTRANHVVHFDRWWNPAVENQATDRAYRIGQTRNVLVHKFVCQGTVEERIDRLIAGKTALAAGILGGGGEAWITELSNAELRDLFTLSLE